MSFTANLVIDLIAIAILAIVFIFTIKSSNRTSMSNNIFIVLVVVSFLLLLADILGRMDGLTEFSVPLANYLGNFLLFTLNPLPAILWVLFLLTHIYDDQSKIRLAILPLMLYFFVHVVGVVLNLFFHFYYTIDTNNVYVRGPLFVITIIWAMIPLITGFVITLIKKHQIDKKKFTTLVFYPIIPIMATILMFFIYGYSIILPAVTIGTLLIFIGIQNDLLVFDYLTGTYNRLDFENYLRRKIADFNPRFGAIMLDIDHYKQINDTYGHLVGDKALVDFASILRDSVRFHDFVARYGGDEFFLVIDTHDVAVMEKVIKRLQTNIDKFNDKNFYPFKLGFSYGYAIYSNSQKPSMEDFVNHLDILMYEDKQKKVN